MSKILKVLKPSDYSAWVGHPASHALISVINYSEISPVRYSLNDYDVYGLFLQGKEYDFDLVYGTGKYEFSQDTLICVAPGQVGGKEDNGEFVSLSGWAVLFHPDLLQGTGLENEIKKFPFFDYRINEALHMTKPERDVLVQIMSQLEQEVKHPSDIVSDRIIVGYINLLLRYAQRFYERQFASRTIANNSVLARLENLLRNYFEQNRQLENGQPTVQSCSRELCMSPNYLSDIIKKATGETANRYIKRFIVQLAKNKLVSGMNSSEVAYYLGFDYPQHFARMFKKMTGKTPSDYCKSRKVR